MSRCFGCGGEYEPVTFARPPWPFCVACTGQRVTAETAQDIRRWHALMAYRLWTIAGGEPLV